MVKTNTLKVGLLKALRGYAKDPVPNLVGYQEYCRAYPDTWNKIIKECTDAKQKRIKEESVLG
jgi:hypothetical protein